MLNLLKIRKAIVVLCVSLFCFGLVQAGFDEDKLRALYKDILNVDSPSFEQELNSLCNTLKVRSFKLFKEAEKRHIILRDALENDAFLPHEVLCDEGDWLLKIENYSLAAYYFLKASKAGNLRAKSNLGSLYLCGKGVEKNSVKAIRLIKDSANGGCIVAQYNLGKMLYYGIEIEQDQETGFRLIKDAAENGDANAQNDLGSFYKNNDNISDALYWLKKSANQGCSQAAYALGMIYYNGEGIDADIQTARNWFYLAGLGGVDDGFTMAKEIDEFLVKHFESMLVVEDEVEEAPVEVKKNKKKMVDF